MQRGWLTLLWLPLSCCTALKSGSDRNPSDARTDRGGAQQASCRDRLECCSDEAGRDDPTCDTCGDGVIAGSETCDPIATCPTRDTCVSSVACIVAQFSGDPDTCTARCELKRIASCISGDGCCPSGCDPASDHDCSTGCGDGKIDAKAGETCEPDSKSTPCAIDCDDGDPCTNDLKTGSPDNCNVACLNPAILEPANGDGCCPSGAHSLNDTDCKPRCGNGVLEKGEQCDGSPGCAQDCTEGSDEQGGCMRLQPDSSTACAACTCDKCMDRVRACLDSGDAARDRDCASVDRCVLRTGCGNGTCYCGSSAGCVSPNGLCRAEIEAATGSDVPNMVLLCGSDPTCLVNRAYDLDSCRRQNCADECNRPSP